jgi:hypothetical protein
MKFFTSRRQTLFAAAFLLLAPTLILAKAGELRMRTALTGGAISGLTPSGRADYRAAAQGRADFSVEVQDVNLPAGTTLDVTVDGAAAGTITVSAAPIRGGELDLNTQDGDVVPAVKAGSVVVVSNAGAAILSGVLR